MTEDNKRLYPVRFIPEGENVAWGRETYKIADLGHVDSMVEAGWLGGNTLSEVIGTYFERVVGDASFDFYGLQFPLLVKTIETTSFQPLRVNVADDVAEERYDSLGKMALWIVEKAEPGAKIVLGFSRGISAEKFFSSRNEGGLEEELNFLTPKAGDRFLIQPGTVFAAGPGLRILEISECSEMSFPIAALDGGALDPEEDFLEEAFDLIDFSPYSPSPLLQLGGENVNPTPYTTKIASCEQFTITKVNLSNLLRVFTDEPMGFTIYHCAAGAASVKVPKEGVEVAAKGEMPADGSLESYPLKAGQSILVPAEVSDFYLVPEAEGTVLYEAVAEKRELRDEYVEEDVSATLPGEEEAPDPHVRFYN